MHLIGWLSLPHLVVFILELWSVLSFGQFFFFPSWCFFYLKGQILGDHWGGVMLVPGLWSCTWGRGPEGAMAPASLSSGFQSFTPIPTIKLGPSGAGSPVGGLVHTLGPCGSLQRPLLWGWESLLLLPQPPRALSIRGLRLYFPELEPWVAQSASLPAVHPVYLCANVGPRGATHCSACPAFRHSESGPLGLSAQM